MKNHPDWATKHKQKGTELRFINGKYYLYQVTSKWNPKKKRSQKITGKILGRITKEEGFIESEKRRLQRNSPKISSLSIKEYGVVSFIDTFLSEYKLMLKKHFPACWQTIIALVYGRFVHHSPMKNIGYHYQHSYLSEQYPEVSLSPKYLTKVLREIGGQRDKITSFFGEFTQAKDNILFDGTDLLSNSKKMDIPKKSKTKKGTFNPIVNIMFVFSINLQLPTYYRILPGNIKDIRAFKLCLEESQIFDAIIIADKGFYSENNIDELKHENLNFIIPLRRNSSLVSYQTIKNSNKESFDGFFMYEDRVIWYYRTEINTEHVTVFLDEELKSNEIKDYLRRTESLPEKYNLKTFQEKQHTFGTLAVISNVNKGAEEVYSDYKNRGQIEGMIDVLKNIIDADKSYMQNQQALEAWMFTNYIALHWYYHIIKLLKKHELNSKFSPMDLIMFLSEVKKVKINNKWHNAEITKKTSDLLNKLNIHIT